MKENVYFDNAATTWPKPEVVYRFMDRFFRSHGVNPGRSGHTLAVEAEAMIVATRSMLAECLGFAGDPARVVFTQNGTDALNLAIAGRVSSGDHVIVTRLEHNAVLRTLAHLERDRGVAVTRVAPDAAGYVSPADIEAAVRDDTRLIVVNHASNVIGTVQPIEAISEIATAHGIPLVLDAAQTAGVLPIDMDALRLAVLCFPGHKGLFGPMGIGGMIVAEHVELPPQRFGGTGVDSWSTYQPEAYPHRFEAGTVALPAIAGLNAAQGWFRELGAERLAAEGIRDVQDGAKLCRAAVEHVHRTENAHVERIHSALRRYEHVRVLGSPQADARVATLSFVSSRLPTALIADMLDADHHVCARAGLQCAPMVHVDAGTVDGGGAVRLSPGYFTDEADMDQLLAALDDILG